MTSADLGDGVAKPIVVGVDGSASSKAALTWAARQAKFTGMLLGSVSEFLVVNACSPVVVMRNHLDA